MATIGYLGKISQGGTPTTLTAAPCTLVTGKTYQINAVANRVLDPATAITVLDNGIAVAAANIANVNAMNGKVTFASTYVPTTPITITGKYIPRAVVASVKGVKSSPKNLTVDVTSVNSAGYVMRLPSLQDWSGSFDIFDYASNQGLAAIVSGRTACLLDYDPTAAGTGVTRGWVVLKQSSGEVDPKAAILTSVQFDLFDQSNVATTLSGFTVIASFAVATT